MLFNIFRMNIVYPSSSPVKGTKLYISLFILLAYIVHNVNMPITYFVSSCHWAAPVQQHLFDSAGTSLHSNPPSTDTESETKTSIILLVHYVKKLFKRNHFSYIMTSTSSVSLLWGWARPFEEFYFLRHNVKLRYLHFKCVFSRQQSLTTLTKLLTKNTKTSIIS